MTKGKTHPMLQALTMVTLLVYLLAGAIAAGSNMPPVIHDSDLSPTADNLGTPADAQAGPQLGKLQQSGAHTALGTNAFSGLVVDNTYWDLGSNGSVGRKIARGSDGRVHFVYMHLPTSSGNRVVRYASWTASGGLSSGIDVSEVGGGFPSADVGGNKAVIAWHVSTTGAYAAMDYGSGTGSFSDVLMPTPNCEGILSGWAGSEGKYLWPQIAYDNTNSIAHIVSTEIPPETSPPPAVRSLVYYRGTGGSFTNFGTCGKFIDSVYTVSAVVVKNPSNSNVAIVYMRPVSYAYNKLSQWNNNVYYVESTDNGVTWGPKHNVSNYGAYSMVRGAADLDAMYTADGCLQIVWVSVRYNAWTKKPMNNYEGRLFHWSSCLGTSPKKLLVANNFQTCLPSNPTNSFNRNVAKPSISECTVGGNKRLYVTYTWYNGTMSQPDCSAANWANGELYCQQSTNGGATWGKAVNLTGTRTNGCSAGSCESEVYASQVMNVSDTLRILYIGDKDAGGWNGGSNPEGSATLNPVLYTRVPCYPQINFANLWPRISEVRYPNHVQPLVYRDTNLIFENLGNIATTATVIVTYTSGSGWISLPNGSTFNVAAGDTGYCRVRMTGPASEGLYEATLNISYNDGSGTVVIAVPVDLYNFADFHLPQVATLHTATLKLGVQQTSRCGWLAWDTDDPTYTAGEDWFSPDSNGFTYNADHDLPYLFDASLIIGNSANNLSTMIYRTLDSISTDRGGVWPMFALDDLASDTTGGYRMAGGKGCNYDSTVAFDVTYYAPKSPDSSDFYVAYFKVYKGPKNPTGTVAGVSIAYASDWDIPSDGNLNTAGADPSLQMLYQRGASTGTSRFGAIAAFRADNNPVAGGFVWDNEVYAYPNEGYHRDSLWKYIQVANGFAGASGEKDFSSLLVVGRNMTISGTNHDTVRFAVVLCGQPSGGSLADLKGAVSKAKRFITNHIPGNWYFPPTFICGDADGNGFVNISDAVYLINYIFSGGPAPNPLEAGDVDCNGMVNISDAVYLINYIFGGGAEPCEACK